MVEEHRAEERVDSLCVPGAPLHDPDHVPVRPHVSSEVPGRKLHWSHREPERPDVSSHMPNRKLYWSHREPA